MPPQRDLAPSPRDRNGAAEDAVEHEGFFPIAFPLRWGTLLVGTLGTRDDLVGHLPHEDEEVLSHPTVGFHHEGGEGETPRRGRVEVLPVFLPFAVTGGDEWLGRAARRIQGSVASDGMGDRDVDQGGEVLVGEALHEEVDHEVTTAVIRREEAREAASAHVKPVVPEEPGDSTDDVVMRVSPPAEGGVPVAGGEDVVAHDARHGEAATITRLHAAPGFNEVRLRQAELEAVCRPEGGR